MSVYGQVPLREPLVGREGELEEFEEVWNAGRCHSVVISGPAGVGKTRLAEAALEYAVEQGWREGKALASAAAATVPLGALAHLLPRDMDLSDPVTGFAVLVQAWSGRRPAERLALLVDDLHLLDATSALLLRQLTGTGAVRMIATIRSGETDSEAVQALLSGDAVHRVDLGAFDEKATADMLAASLRGPVDRRSVSELYGASGGNALFLREIVLGALQRGEITTDGEMWTLTGSGVRGSVQLSEIIGERLRAVPEALPVLELLACCEPVALADARQIATWDELASLEEKGFLHVTTGRRRTTLHLAHPLHGEVLRAAMSPQRRRQVLLQQAERIEAYGSNRRDDALYVASWRLMATGTADPALLREGAVLARYAHDYEQVTTLLGALPEEEQTTHTRLMTGEAYFQMGKCTDGERVLARASALTTNEQETVAVALARTSNLLFSGRPVEEALAANAEALEKLSDAEARRMLRINEGYMRVGAGQPVEGLALLDDLDEDGGRVADVNAWLRGVFLRPAALAAVGRSTEAIHAAERAFVVHSALDEQALVSHPEVERIPLVLALTEAGRLKEAVTVGEYAYADIAAAGLMARIWVATSIARALWLAGRVASARTWWAEAAVLARGTEHGFGLRLALGGVIACAALLGDLAAAETAAKEFNYLTERPGLLSAEEELGIAWLHAARGDCEEACRVLEGMAAQARERGQAAAEAMCLTDIARLGGAAAVSDRLTALATVCDGDLMPARVRMSASLARQNGDGLMEAAKQFKAVGADLMAAEAAAAAAGAWRRCGEPRKAAAATQRAAVWAAQCENARTPLLDTHATMALLTPREREVAVLAATGHPSKDIAAHMQLSARTVDNHLQRVYAKFGLTTRRDLSSVLQDATLTALRPPADAPPPDRRAAALPCP
ncbi:response regulator transcription factor [Streptomyces sp. NPDC058701]|uniref:helix-turn-helix transcriptional regulator n=1 Tax=Streptomyces sp. NPDC058701 TaxID=3346608 RepID=UPI00365C8415